MRLTGILIIAYALHRTTLSQGCTSGDVRLLSSMYSGLAEYCHQGEWIGICSRQWNSTYSELICRDIVGNHNQNDESITMQESSEPRSRSLQLTCTSTDSQLSQCSSSIQTTACAIVNVTCQGFCTRGGRCTCIDGWEGFKCRARCSTPCANQGTCIGIDECNCQAWWRGATCTEFWCPLQCENGGTCSGPQQCTCTSEWQGPQCQQAVCQSQCTNGGVCARPGQCNCTNQWEGETCSRAICTLDCENGGSCTAPDECTCSEEWTGPTCKQPVCSDEFCLNGGDCAYPDTNCTCPVGWEGDRCETVICEEGFCENGGNCSYPNLNCTCPEQWTGPRCQVQLCEEGFCENGGNCSSFGLNCTCTDQWTGLQCQTALCQEGFCENGGVCLYPDTNCTCPDGWEGDRCETEKETQNCLANCSCSYQWIQEPCIQNSFLEVAATAIGLVILLGLISVSIIFMAQYFQKTKPVLRGNMRETIELQKIQSNLGMKANANIAYGVVQDQVKEQSEEIYYEVVGNKTKRVPRVKQSKDLKYIYS